MTNRFTITIASVDRATAGIRRIKKSVATLFRPAAQLRRSFGMLGRELGLPKVAAGIKSVTRGLAGIITPLNAILGIGTLAGLAKLAASWGEVGFNAARSAKTIGVSVKELQRLRGIARLAHVDPDAAEGNLNTFASNMQNARYGRDNDLADFMRFNGIKFRHKPDGNVDTMAMLKDVSRFLSQQKDPQAQLMSARRFGLEELLPVLREGPEAMDKLADAAEKAGIVLNDKTIAATEEFTKSLDRLRVVADGYWQAIAGKAAPGAARALDWLANLLDEDRKAMESPPDPKNRESFLDLMSRVVTTPLRWGLRAGQSDEPQGRRFVSGKVVDERGTPPAAGKGYQTKPFAKTVKATDAWEWNEHGQRVRVADQPDRVRIFQDEYERTTNPRDREALLREMQRMGIEPRQPAQEQKVSVEVNLRNAPPGTTATATSSSGQPVPARVTYSMGANR